jgi:hypothetical protein
MKSVCEVGSGAIPCTAKRRSIKQNSTYYKFIKFYNVKNGIIPYDVGETLTIDMNAPLKTLTNGRTK